MVTLVVTLCLMNFVGQCQPNSEFEQKVSHQAPSGVVAPARTCPAYDAGPCLEWPAADTSALPAPMTIEECQRNGEAYAEEWLAEHPGYAVRRLRCESDATMPPGLG